MRPLREVAPGGPGGGGGLGGGGQRCEPAGVVVDAVGLLVGEAGRAGVKGLGAAGTLTDGDGQKDSVAEMAGDGPKDIVAERAGDVVEAVVKDPRQAAQDFGNGVKETAKNVAGTVAGWFGG